MFSKDKRSIALYFIPGSFFSVFFSNAVLGDHRTDLNQTLPHVGKGVIFENVSPNPKFSPKTWGPKLPIFGCFTTTSRLSTNIFTMKRATLTNRKTSKLYTKGLLHHTFKIW